MHHFSPAFRFDIDKGGCYGTASPLVRWLELHWCPTALFSSSERGAAGMDLQDKCSCVCVSESSGTKRPFQSADGMEKVSIMQTSNQSKTKARMQNILTLWSWNCGWFFCHTGNTADRTWGSDGLRWWIKYVVDSVFYKGVHFSAVTSGSSSVTPSRTLSHVWMCFQEHEEY